MLSFRTVFRIGLFSRYVRFFTALSRLAYNGMAAWRSGGIYALPFKSALPAAVAPNRLLRAGILRQFVCRTSRLRRGQSHLRTAPPHFEGTKISNYFHFLQIREINFIFSDCTQFSARLYFVRLHSLTRVGCRSADLSGCTQFSGWLFFSATFLGCT
jgi:hypothetical protein